MGIYDREYYREEEQTRLGGAGRTMVTNLLIANLVIFVVDAFFFEPNHQISWYLSLKANVLHTPWNLWQLLTYGFVHDPHDFRHIAFNMFSLWMFGREVEAMYGAKEFLRIYLAMIVAGGLFWLAVMNVTMPGADVPVLGASGAVVGTIVLWTCLCATRSVMVMGMFPMRGWVFGVVFLVGGELMSFSDPENRTAHSVHFAGAALAFIYYRRGWNLGRLIPRRWSLSALKLRPKLRLHDPEFDERELNREVDKILEKISREGEASLSKKERRTLEEASRRYQRKRQ